MIKKFVKIVVYFCGKVLYIGLCTARFPQLNYD